MHAQVSRNDGAQPHNRDAWTMQIFDDDGNLIGDALLYDRNISSKLTLEQQLVMALPHHTADVSDVRRDGAGYRIERLRPR